MTFFDSPPIKKLYEQDFNLWLEKTCHQIRQKDYTSVDWDNLLEELESLGRQEKHELANRLTVLLEHLLKLAFWEAEKAYNARGWRGTIREQRKQIARLLKASPSLKPYLTEIFEECYRDAREITIDKTGLSSEGIPLDAFLTIEQALDENWLPD
jgi:DNA-directed RNA polymerase subunit F